jgi:hypothetical protein
LNAILQFLKLLYENKEKIILAALVVAFIAVGAVLFRGEKDGGPADKKPKTGGTPEIRDPVTVPLVRLGNQHVLDILIENTSPSIFFPSKVTAGGGDKEKGDVWAEITIKSVFDATNSGSFVAIVEVDKKRRFLKEGDRFGGYSITRIDGIRKCLTIVRRGAQKGEEEKEFCAKD